MTRDRAPHDRAPHGDTPPGSMPPDPWSEEGVDLWTLERAEDFIQHGLDSADPRWDDLDGPTIDEFDDANTESEIEDGETYGSGLIGGMRPWMGAIALLIIVAMVLTYAFR